MAFEPRLEGFREEVTACLIKRGRAWHNDNMVPAGVVSLVNKIRWAQVGGGA